MPTSPAMPHLEAFPPISVHSENISTASSTGILDARLKDIGGKSSFKDGPNKVGEGETGPASVGKRPRRTSTPLSHVDTPRNSSADRRSDLSDNADAQPLVIEKIVYRSDTSSEKLERHAETARNGRKYHGRSKSSSESEDGARSNTSRTSSVSSRASSSSSRHKSRKHKDKKRETPE